LCIDRNDYAYDVVAGSSKVRGESGTEREGSNWEARRSRGVNAYFPSRIVIAGLVAKKLCGIRVKPNQWVGMTGQSSIRVTW
jgi:hypothetical protein